ncbi:MAG: LD-carboxypeptidase [Flavobacterium sp.]|nr:MAG: LD-carboxypeptidase [Flavobacterium sp.]
MIIPPYLKSGDKVGIVSTAKRTTPEEIAPGIATLTSWGLIPVVGRHAYNENYFMAGTDEERAEDLQMMLDDPAIRAVFFTKGGYGTLRIIDKIDFTAFRENPKWIAGYSDITVLHSHIHNFGIATLHSVMLQGMPNSNAESAETLRKALFGESLHYEIQSKPENKLNGNGAEGVLVGGNLSVLYALVGSESGIDTEGKILFIEDIDEYLYHFDRMLLSLKRSGKLAELKALVIGDMTDIKESTIPFGPTYQEMILLHTEEYNYPVYFGFPAGHTKDNRAMVFGANLKIGENDNNITFDF